MQLPSTKTDVTNAHAATDALVAAIKLITDALPDSVWEGNIDTEFCGLTREGALQEAGGIGIRKTDIAIAGNGAQVINCFKITGCIQLKEIILILTAVTDSTTFSNVKFTVSDGATDVDLCTVVDGSAAVAGSKFVKMENMTQALKFMNGSGISVLENSAFQRPFVEPFTNAKVGADNYIQLKFTGDGATDITGTMYVRYTPSCSNGKIEVVV